MSDENVEYTSMYFKQPIILYHKTRNVYRITRTFSDSKTDDSNARLPQSTACPANHLTVCNDLLFKVPDAGLFRKSSITLSTK